MSLTQLGPRGWLASLLGLGLLSPAAALADDEDTSTDALGDLKGSDRVDKKEAKVDRSNANSFEKDRFFIDKIDTPDTEEATLFQGNFTSSTFFYSESSEQAEGAAGAGETTTGSKFSRLFTDLRAQLDARHLRGGRWQARVDARFRLATNPEDVSNSGRSDTMSQSGLTGDNELEIRELWITRPGDRYDVFLGRQFVPDLGAIKIDGVRVDYAKSDRVTLLGYAGAYPLRGSRSVTTDYAVLKDADGDELGRTPPIAAGAGAAYRTALSYGSFGAGTVAPLKGETPRVYVTSTGYLRRSSQLDLYHFALIDLVGEGGFAFNNLSAGINYRPVPALRATLSVNHVDTETLNVQAQVFLEPNDTSIIRNDTAVRRISSTQGQAGLSVALGQTQQIEGSVTVAYRRRPDVTVPNGMGTFTFTASQSVDVGWQVVHRNLFRTRVGADGVRAYSVGDASSRATYLAFRAFASREFKQGRGNWEAEVGYSTARDDGMLEGELSFGRSKISTLSAGGTVYYRVGATWFVMGSASLGRLTLASKPVLTEASVEDSPVTQLSGFLRAAYRF